MKICDVIIRKTNETIIEKRWNRKLGSLEAIFQTKRIVNSNRTTIKQ